MANNLSKLPIPRTEILIIIIFFISFVIWVIPKCNGTKEDLRNQALQDAIEKKKEELEQQKVEELEKEKTNSKTRES